MSEFIKAVSQEQVLKTEHGIPIRNLWHMMLYAWNEMPHSSFWQRFEVEKSPSLDALFASILIQLIQQRMRIGLGCNYMPEQRQLRGVRGRIQFTQSLKQRTFEKGQTICNFEQYSINAPKNQIIRSTLNYLAQTGMFGANEKRGEAIRHTLRQLVRTLDGIDLLELTPDFIHRQQAIRHDRDYRIMLAVCDLVLQRRMPTEFAGQAFASHLERDRLTIHRLYESFVANFLNLNLSSWDVKAQRKLQWHDTFSNQFLPAMRPDIILKEQVSGKLIVLDTKFTAKSLIKNQWGKKIFNSGHLYQIYSYLKTQEHLSEQHRQAAGILLYPAIEEELSEQIELPDHQICIDCVNLAAPWPQIEQRLLEVILSRSNSQSHSSE